MIAKIPRKLKNKLKKQIIDVSDPNWKTKEVKIYRYNTKKTRNFPNPCPQNFGVMSYSLG